MTNIYKLPLVLEPQPEGGYTITCPILPNLVTEADTLDEVAPHVADALGALIELYQDLNKPLPAILQPMVPTSTLWTDMLVKDLKTGTLRKIVRLLDLDWQEFKRT